MILGRCFSLKIRTGIQRVHRRQSDFVSALNCFIGFSLILAQIFSTCFDLIVVFFGVTFGGNASWQGLFRIATMLTFLGAVHGQDLA